MAEKIIFCMKPLTFIAAIVLKLVKNQQEILLIRRKLKINVKYISTIAKNETLENKLNFS